jgi:predicted nucleotidyltransferase
MRLLRAGQRIARPLNCGVMRHVSMDPQIEAMRSELGAWARRQPGLRRLWIYGSRAQGTHRPDSDLDIAFEIDRLPDSAAAAEFLERTRPAWRAELSQLSGLLVHLEPSVGDASDVAGYVADSGVLVYDRDAKGLVGSAA